MEPPEQPTLRLALCPGPEPSAARVAWVAGELGIPSIGTTAR